MNVYQISPERITEVWPIVRNLLAKAEEVSNGRFSADTMLSHMQNGTVKCLTIVDEHGVINTAAAINVYEYPDRKVLLVHSLGGEGLADWATLLDFHLERIAREWGCTMIEWVGRLGWKRVAEAHGYKLASVTFEKVLS